MNHLTLNHDFNDTFEKKVFENVGKGKMSETIIFTFP